MKVLLKAVGYLRRSRDDAQADSIEIQREAVTAYALKHGFQIVRWYIDDGISGHNTDRDDFVRMIEDAEKSDDFQYVIVRHQSRFARFRPAKTIRYLDRLDDVGVKLVTTKKGVIDINDLAQFLMASIEAQTDHTYSKTLSELTISGQAKKARDGKSAGQRAPYGMDRMLCNEQGERKARVRAGEKVAKPDGWYTTFVPSDDPYKVAIVQEIYRMFLAGKSPWSIAKELNHRSVPAPRGGKWNKGTIVHMLQNEIYCGDFAWNKRREGKFHSLSRGKAVERPQSESTPHKSGRRKHAVFMNDQDDWIVKDNAHEGIIDKSDWLAVQVRIHRMDKNRHPNRGSAASGGYKYALSGLVYCECGAKMHGRITRRRKNGKEYKKRKYICYAYDSGGNCKHNWADAEDLHKKVVELLVARLRDPDTLDRLTAGVNREATKSHDLQPAIKQLSGKLAKLDQEVKAAATRMMTVPEDVMEDAVTTLRELKHRRHRLEAELANLGSQAAVQNRSKHWTPDKVEAALDVLAQRLEQAEHEKLHQILKSTIDRVVLQFNTVDGKQRLSGGEIHLLDSTDSGMAGTGFEPATSRL
jgi:DNA invertase Pin-like site-specific DNA recombinase